MCIENKLSSQGIFYLSYILSWVKEGGDFSTDCYWWTEEECEKKYRGLHGFRKWLSATGLQEEEQKEIVSMTGMGKLEAEESIRYWFKHEEWRKE